MSFLTSTLSQNRVKSLALIITIGLVALSLRAPLAAIGALTDAIQQATNLSHGLIGLITTLPLLCFGFLSTMLPLATQRWGIEGTLSLGLLVLAVGIIMRSFSPIVALYGGTLLVGIGITIGNVLLPSLVKRDFPNKRGWMTSLYSSLMGLGATVAAGISVPIASNLGWGWRYSQGIWALLPIAAILLWIPQINKFTVPDGIVRIRSSIKRLSTSLLAWQIAFFMGLQSFIFYVVLAWLPEMLISQGIGVIKAGWMLSLSQGMGVVGTILIPIYAERLSDHRKMVVAIGILEIISIGGFMLPNLYLVPLWAGIIGFTLGGSFGLALFFIVIRAPDSETTTELSGMAQSIGYLVAASGPVIFGWLHDTTNNWMLPLLLLIVVAFFQLIAGLGAGKNKTITC